MEAKQAVTHERETASEIDYGRLDEMRRSSLYHSSSPLLAVMTNGEPSGNPISRRSMINLNLKGEAKTKTAGGQPVQEKSGKTLTTTGIKFAQKSKKSVESVTGQTRSV